MVEIHAVHIISRQTVDRIDVIKEGMKIIFEILGSQILSYCKRYGKKKQAM
jgi:hypothetical protein